MRFESERQELSLTGWEGNNRKFGEQACGLKGTEVSLSSTTIVIGEGVVKPGVGKYSEVLGLNQGTTSGERGVTRVSPTNSRSGGENSAGTLPKFRLRETPTEGK
jgi:hypothetical protein